MFEELKEINARPKPFEFYTASDMGADEVGERKADFTRDGQV